MGSQPQTGGCSADSLREAGCYPRVALRFTHGNTITSRCWRSCSAEIVRQFRWGKDRYFPSQCDVDVGRHRLLRLVESYRVEWNKGIGVLRRVFSVAAFGAPQDVGAMGPRIETRGNRYS